MSDRRDFLKLFGIGAIIAPIAEGKVLHEATSKIIEPPKVELVENTTQTFSSLHENPNFCTVTFSTPIPGGGEYGGVLPNLWIREWNLEYIHNNPVEMHPEFGRFPTVMAIRHTPPRFRLRLELEQSEQDSQIYITKK